MEKQNKNKENFVLEGYFNNIFFVRDPRKIRIPLVDGANSP